MPAAASNIVLRRHRMLERALLPARMVSVPALAYNTRMSPAQSDDTDPLGTDPLAWRPRKAPSLEVLDHVGLDSEFDLLGLFQGVGLPFRHESAPVQMPNMVWLYRRPILDYWAEHDETLGAIVAHVLVHEIGHHFG